MHHEKAQTRKFRSNSRRSFSGYDARTSEQNFKGVKMHPIPCSHCGYNFMRPTNDPEAPKLCNSCLVREEKRCPKKEVFMKTIDIVIKCPIDTHSMIEEYCMNKGISFSQYFLSLDQLVDIQADYIKEISSKENNELKQLQVNPTKHEQKKQKRS